MSNQSDLQQWVRDQTGTAYDYNGDWLSLFDQDGVASGSFNGRMLTWLNAQLGTSYSNINEAQNAYAISCGVENWGSLAEGVPVAPAGYGFLRVGSPGSSQLVRVGSDNSAPRILIPTGA